MVHFFSWIFASVTFEPVPLEDSKTDGLPLLGIVKLFCKLSCHIFSLLQMEQEMDVIPNIHLPRSKWVSALTVHLHCNSLFVVMLSDKTDKTDNF